MSPEETCRRPVFHYDESSLIRRIGVGVGQSTAVPTSVVQQIPYRVWCKFLVIFLLIFIGLTLTPQALPSRLGLEWATARKLLISAVVPPS
jgi:hypothetical protein